MCDKQEKRMFDPTPITLQAQPQGLIIRFSSLAFVALGIRPETQHLERPARNRNVPRLFCAALCCLGCERLSRAARVTKQRKVAQALSPTASNSVCAGGLGWRVAG